MKKVLTVMMIVLVFTCLSAAVVFAQAAKEAAAASGDSPVKSTAVIVAGITIAVAAFGTGIAQGMSVSKACEGAARNPGAANKIQTLLIIGLAMIESLCIYALIVSLGILINQKMFF